MANALGMFAFLVLLASPSALAGAIRDRLGAWHEDPLEQGDSAAGEPALPARVRVLRDVRYGDDRRQAMDVYLPHDAKNAPVILMVHGGAWRTGDKTMRTVVESKVARWLPRGFLFVSVNYRMLPQYEALQQADDVARALAYAQAKAAAWGGDPSKFILMGHSAGAHLVSLLSAAPARAYAFGAKPWLGTVALDSAAFDVVAIMEARHPRFYDNAFGTDGAHWRQASPIHVLVDGATPLLAVCSTQRPDHPCTQARAYAAKANARGIRVQVLEQALSHRQINENLGKSGTYSAAVEAFMGLLDEGVKKPLIQ